MVRQSEVVDGENSGSLPRFIPSVRPLICNSSLSSGTRRAFGLVTPTFKKESKDAPEEERLMDEIVSVEAVTRRFPLNHDRTRNHDRTHNMVSALNDASLGVEAGEFLAIAGPSGSGKTTLLNLIGCIDQPTSGRVLIEGVDMSRLSPGRVTALRREKIGSVFQAFNLIPVFTAAESVEYPLPIAGVSSPERHERVAEALDSVGLSARAGHRPDLLSGGERQRETAAGAQRLNTSTMYRQVGGETLGWS